MSGDFVDERVANYKGLQFYFNSYTKRGRLNWVMATYGTLFGYYLFSKLRRPKAPVAAKK